MSEQDLFNVAVPDSELEAPAFQPIPTGTYLTTLQPGAELASNDAGWTGIRLPFQGFTDPKTGTTYARALRAQFTIKHSNPQAVKIGNQAVMGAAQALGLTEPTVTAEGKPAQKLTAATPEELVSQFNQMAGTQVEVYLTAGPRKRNGAVVNKEDGTPWMDNEIKRVSAVRV